MLLILIKSLAPRAGVDVPSALKNLCWEVSRALGLKAEEVRAVWETISPGHYVEGLTPADSQRPATHPPLVTLLSPGERPPEQARRLLDGVASCLSRELKLQPGNVMVTCSDIPPDSLLPDG